MVSATPSPALETRTRIKKATCAFHALAKVLLLRNRLFKALVVSFFLDNSDVWVHTLVRVWWAHMFYLRCFRMVGGYPRAPISGKERLSDAQVLFRCRCRVCFLSLLHAVLVSRCRRTVVPWALCSAPWTPMTCLPTNGRLSCFVISKSLFPTNLDKMPARRQPSLTEVGD